MENTGEGSQDNDRSGLVTARGTGDGLVIRLDGSVDPLELHESLAEFMTSRKSFLEGNEVALEWVGAMPEKAMVDSLSSFLSREFSITVRESRFKEMKRAGSADVKTEDVENHASPILSVRSIKNSSNDRTGKSESAFAAQRNRFTREPSYRGLGASGQAARGEQAQSKRVSLFDGIEVMGMQGDEEDTHVRYSSDAATRERSRGAINPLLWDDPDARIINMTLRGGQRVESDHSIIIRGDVNSGAEVIAGGDIVILGTLRGVAHAGAFDDTGGGRSIIALSLQPTQLRIGSLISRGKNEHMSNDAGQGIEVARIEGNIIVVEPYQVRGGSRR